MFDTVLQKHIFKTFGGIFAAGVCLIVSTDLRAELPAVKFRSVFPELTLDRPVRMEEANDGSGRFFVLEQKGRIVIVPKHRGSKAAGL
jgi:hypothetical protein